MDNFKEEIVIKKGGKVYRTILYILAYLFIVFFGVIGFVGLSAILNMQFELVRFIQLVLGGGAVWMIWRNKDNFNTEFEYTFTNGEMDFAKVLGGKRRKQLLTLRLNDVEAGGSVQLDSYKRFSSMPGVKTYDFTLNDNVPQYYLYFIREGNKHMILLECSEAMWDMIEQSNPRLGK